ncbi:hypothetical protein U9M48_037391 [Paspalum notatum var. saurae]|uniref:Uncharacterized protein n=1 Tax=Paspalum notatum var. saurae TaxID=547442 RepID=A0AAQ3UJL4_PASNO
MRRRRLEIDWKDVFGATSPAYSERDLCFGDPLPAVGRARAAGPAARASSLDEQQSQGTLRLHQKLRRRRVGGRRRPRAQAEAGAWGTDAPPAAAEDAGSSSAEDERREHASPSAALGGEKNYGQLCYAALSGRNRCKFHAADAEESDHEEFQKSEKPTFSCCTKRRILCKSLVGAAPPEEIFEALRTIPSLARADLLRAYSMLIDDDRRFRSLMALPKDMRKDWLLMDLDRSQ